ncbi:MAG TPA: amidohydrolase family protein [Terriglobales bacterium]|nr:amidohydrolase family protein [Terriglobales bacterium]
MIDFHTHPVLIQELAKKYPDYERASREVFQIGNNFQPLETFFLQMDVAGIDRAVLLPIDCRRARKLGVSSNEQVAELCAGSSRFIGFASVDPARKGAAKELQQAVEGLGLRGLKLDPALQDFDPHDAGAFAVYEVAESLGIPVLVHTGMSWAPETPLERCHPLSWEQPVRRFSKLNFILAHFGWPWVWDAIAMALKYPNVYLDTSCLYYDSPKEFFQFVFSKQVPTTLIERSLRNKIVFGSNYPRVEIKNMVHALKSLALTEGCLHRIFVENAERLLAKPERKTHTAGRG